MADLRQIERLQQEHYDICRWLYSKINEEGKELAVYLDKQYDSKALLRFIPNNTTVFPLFASLANIQRNEVAKLKELYNVICAPIIEQNLREKARQREIEDEAYAEKVREEGRPGTYLSEPWR